MLDVVILAHESELSVVAYSENRQASGDPRDGRAVRASIALMLAATSSRPLGSIANVRT